MNGFIDELFRHNDAVLQRSPIRLSQHDLMLARVRLFHPDLGGCLVCALIRHGVPAGDVSGNWGAGAAGGGARIRG